MSYLLPSPPLFPECFAHGDLCLRPAAAAVAQLCAGVAAADTHATQAHSGRVCPLPEAAQPRGDPSLAGAQASLQVPGESVVFEIRSVAE